MDKENGWQDNEKQDNGKWMDEWYLEVRESSTAFREMPMTSKWMCAIEPTRLWLWRHQLPIKAGVGGWEGAGNNLRGKSLHEEHLHRSSVLSHTTDNQMTSVSLPPMVNKRHISWRNWPETFSGLKTPGSLKGKVINAWMFTYWTVGIQALSQLLPEGRHSGALEKINNTRERLICDDISGVPNRKTQLMTIILVNIFKLFILK